MPPPGIDAGHCSRVSGEFPGVCHSSVSFSVKLSIIRVLISSHF